ncbi:MAG: DUF3124 domain-containing protein [Bacteroidota bacterium]
MNKYQYMVLGMLMSVLVSCIEEDPNANAAGEDVISSREIEMNVVNLSYFDTIYVPVYSEIYSETKDVLFTQLTVTLSIRNTSLRDTMYLTTIDYYNTDGKAVRNYLEQGKMLPLLPMQSLDYVIESKNTEGGSGANFLVHWAATNQQLQPVFESIMISTQGQQGISFLTRGISISER